MGLGAKRKDLTQFLPLSTWLRCIAVLFIERDSV